jgi:uncharacterized protein involved in outer membrane biogenesis
MQAKNRRRLVVAVAVLLGLIVVLSIAVRVLLGGDRIKAAIEAQATAALGRPVTIRTATPHLFPRAGLDLTGVVIGSEREVTIEQVTLATGLRALFRRRVEDASISVVRSQIDLRWALALLAAMVDSSARPAVSGGAPGASSSASFSVDSIGSLSLHDVTLVAGKRPLVVSLDSSLSGGDRFVVSRLSGRSDISQFEGSGELTSIASRTGRFTIDAAMLDLDGLMAFLAAATPAGAQQLSSPAGRSAPAAKTPLHIDLDVRAKKGRTLGIDLSDLTTTCSLSGDDVLLKDLKLRAFDGSFAGSGAFRGSTSQPRYEWRGAFESIDVPKLVAFAGAPGALTGRLGGSVSLTAAGADPQAAMHRAEGTTRLTIRDGVLQNMSIVRSVILAFGKPASEQPAGSGDAFNQLATTVRVNGQNLSTNDLTLASRDFDLAGAGTLSLASGALNFHSDVTLSRELSAQAGRDLYRLAREGDRIVLPARITGTVNSPTVFVDVQEALGRALRNRAQDEIKSFLDRLGGRIKKK